MQSQVTPIIQDTWEVAFLRERKARLRAEELLENETRELFNAKQALEQQHATLNKAFEDLKLAKDQLVQSEKMASIGQLAAGVAHEINNPVGYSHSNMSTLKNYFDDLVKYIDCLERHVFDNNALAPEQQQQVNAVRAEVDIDFLRDDLHQLINESQDGLDRVTQIIQDLKHFSHVNEQHFEVVDLHTGIDSTLNIAHNELKYKATVHREFGDIPPVECIASQINQVIMNILVNAGQAIEDQGDIYISTWQQDDHVIIEIEDSGCGIEAEKLSKIFDPFYTTKPVGQGTGLGLALSYGIIEKHHGSIHVDSAPGIGTCFKISLPIVQPADKTHAFDTEV